MTHGVRLIKLLHRSTQDISFMFKNYIFLKIYYYMKYNQSCWCLDGVIVLVDKPFILKNLLNLLYNALKYIIIMDNWTSFQIKKKYNMSLNPNIHKSWQINSGRWEFEFIKIINNYELSEQY